MLMDTYTGAIYLFCDDYFMSLLDKELEAQTDEIICQELQENIHCEKKTLGVPRDHNVLSANEHWK